jgi:hypothetical protein
MTIQTKNPAGQASTGDRAPKTFIGERRAGGVEVFVRDGDVERPLTHHVRHSPGGFEWGYAGSGPAELARCILIEHFGTAAICAECESGWIETDEGKECCWHCGGEVFRLPVSYQKFKLDFIVTLARGEDWEISGAEIEQWARERSSVAEEPQS